MASKPRAGSRVPAASRHRAMRRTTGSGGKRELAQPPFDIEAYVDQAAALIGLPLDPQHRPGVVLNVERIAQLAALVMAFPLPDEAEPAPVFAP